MVKVRIIQRMGRDIDYIIEYKESFFSCWKGVYDTGVNPKLGGLQGCCMYYSFKTREEAVASAESFFGASIDWVVTTI